MCAPPSARTREPINVPAASRTRFFTTNSPSSQQERIAISERDLGHDHEDEERPEHLTGEQRQSDPEPPPPDQQRPPTISKAPSAGTTRSGSNQ
jgi:hypothetical protein